MISWWHILCSEWFSFFTLFLKPQTSVSKPIQLLQFISTRETGRESFVHVYLRPFNRIEFIGLHLPPDQNNYCCLKSSMLWRLQWFHKSFMLISFCVSELLFVLDHWDYFLAIVWKVVIKYSKAQNIWSPWASLWHSQKCLEVFYQHFLGPCHLLDKKYFHWKVYMPWSIKNIVLKSKLLLHQRKL